MQARNGLCPVLLVALLAGCTDEPGSQVTDQAAKPIKLGGDLWTTSQKNGFVVTTNPQGIVEDTILLPGAGPHITTFPPSGDFAYVGGMLDGKLYVIDADSHAVLTSLQVGPTLAHQAKASPDGTTLLVSVLNGQSVVKVAADEINRTWSITGSASTAQFGKPPICTVFRADGQRAYVSLNPSGLAILDVPSMTFTGQLATDGFIACGMIKSSDGNHVTIASSGSGGHIYTLDMTTDTLTDRGSLGAASWHSFIMTSDETVGFGTSPLSDQVVVIGLTTTPVTNLGTITFATAPGASDDQPDAVGGGEMLKDKTMAVSLRAAGKIAFVDIASRQIVKYLDIAAPSTFNPATCQDCAVHGVTIRQFVTLPPGSP